MLRTLSHKELWTARAITAMGYEVWLPMDVRGHRVSYKSQALKIVETVLIPKMLFAAIPENAHGDLGGLWYPPSLVRDYAGVALPVPSCELSIFKAEIENINQLERERIKANSRKPLKKKYRHKFDNFADVKKMLFGFKQTSEDEAA
jgi:hypothetical protein